jgi:hypothetical protein
MTVGLLPGLDQCRWESLKKWVTSKNKKVVQGEISVLVLVDNLSHGCVGEESGVLVAKEGRKEIPEDVGDIILNMKWELGEPRTERLTIANSLGRGNVETVALENRDQTRVPEEEDGVLDVGGKSTLNMLELVHIELAKLK